VQIQGAVQGDVTARRLEILDSGRLWGNIKVDSFVLDDGGFFRGQSEMQGEDEPPLLEARTTVNGDIVEGEATIAERG
jgi:cytoskeletal protein CcmA (bactofilin family)